jgi:hypothetical protein
MSLKTAEEWSDIKTVEVFCFKRVALPDFIRAIQADALRHAAELCSRRNAPNLAKDTQRRMLSVEVDILAEADKLTKP